MRIFVDIILVIVLGLVLGGLATHTSLQKTQGFGAINIGQWSAWPFVGGSRVDPYTAAKVAADGTIPLGAAEGLAFEALSDDRGEALDLGCSYRIAGKTPPARFWTLAAYDLAGAQIMPANGGAAAKHSREIMRFSDGSFSITISPVVASGNWLATDGEGKFKLLLRLYDTPITSSSGLVDPSMPLIEPLGCV